MKRLIFCLFTALTLSACEKSDSPKTNCIPLQPNELIIKSGQICGWCAINDTLTVYEHKATLQVYKKCDSLAQVRSANLSHQQHTDLHNALDINDFTALKLESCAVCYDGCDRWITIQNDTLYHRISYESSDTAAVKSIASLVNQLQALSDSLR